MKVYVVYYHREREPVFQNSRKDLFGEECAVLVHGTFLKREDANELARKLGREYFPSLEPVEDGRDSGLYYLASHEGVCSSGHAFWISDSLRVEELDVKE